MNMAFHKQVLIDKEVLVNIVSNSEANRSLQSTLQPEPLHLLLEFHMQSATGAPVELLIQVTDESDPQLLLTAVISEKSYQSLRSSQGLLVDFKNFPLLFTELIEKCF
ncbi:Spindle assembly abnormal protein 6-like protein [Armadillidium nasatum]|uniref:Spindle assembly abnormal protein 6-like protein n=1 Tax=Armadillidium nasatum TaxID=96803 RepID=A0A5N5TC20_9CRUS|nr:Spindle assembly abnormal protein 6-like protein [Armadillidium nasatum]